MACCINNRAGKFHHDLIAEMTVHSNAAKPRKKQFVAITLLLLIILNHLYKFVIMVVTLEAERILKNLFF
jgi:hypothetical protein